MAVVAILGATGQLGTDLCRRFAEANWRVAALGHSDLDLAEPAAAGDLLGRLRPSLVINAAAMHNVEQCEADPARAFAVNTLGSRALAITCRALDAPLIQISTDYVFDGCQSQPYAETDTPRPLNVYATSKLAGEHAVLAEW